MTSQVQFLIENLRCRRNIEGDFCPKCNGWGVLTYPSTATWRGGIGGAAMTSDVCDACWGTGDASRSGADLRKLRNEEDARVARRAVSLITDSVAATAKSTRPALEALCAELDRLARGRKKRPWFFREAAAAIARILRRSMEGE